MSRPMTTAAANALAAGDVRPVLFFEGVFNDGTLRLCSAETLINWDGQVWIAAGQLVGFEPPEETAAVEAPGWTVSLTGIPVEHVNRMLTEVSQGATGKVWIGFRDTAASLIVDPVLIATGRVDVPTIEDDAETCRITVAYEGHLRDMLRSQELRYTHEEQQRLFPGDLGLEYVTSIIEQELIL